MNKTVSGVRLRELKAIFIMSRSQIATYTSFIIKTNITVDARTSDSCVFQIEDIGLAINT
jgi:hypothetical protein